MTVCLEWRARWRCLCWERDWGRWAFLYKLSYVDADVGDDCAVGVGEQYLVSVAF